MSDLCNIVEYQRNGITSHIVGIHKGETEEELRNDPCYYSAGRTLVSVQAGIPTPPQYLKRLQREQYNLRHRCCPNCGSKWQRQTYIGYVFDDPKTYQDKNEAVCKCGWTGIVHDLTPDINE